MDVTLGFHSSITWTAGTGEDYYARVEGTGGSEFVISASCNPMTKQTSPANDDCAGADFSVTGVTFTGNLCGANAEEIIPRLARHWYCLRCVVHIQQRELRHVLVQCHQLVSNDVLGFMMLDGNTCDDFSDFVGCHVTGTCAGSVESFLSLEPNTDYYFLIYTTDPRHAVTLSSQRQASCSVARIRRQTTTTMEANQDDGSCDFAGVTPANDSCADAIALECNTITTGSTGGSTPTYRRSPTRCRL